MHPYLAFARRFFVVLTFFSMHAGFAAAADGATPVNSGVEYTLIGTYDTQRLDRILGAELDAFMASSTMPKDFRGKFPPARFPVKLYRVSYRSVVPELNNRPTIASGLVAVPDMGATGPQTLPLVSYQHGTVFDKTYVPSNPENSMETRIMIARFASQGYVVIGADYFGRGVSDLPDSYLVKNSTQQATFDMLQAARDVLGSMQIQSPQLFVSGWSQGGWATMVFLQKLEAVGTKVVAAAAASAPVDIYVTMNRWMNNYQPVDAVYLPGVVAIQLQAQEFYLQQGGITEQAIRPEYLQVARDLYNNKTSWESFYSKSKPRLQDFINPAFSASGATGAAPYWQVLDRNQAYRWKSVTPLRTYYGGQDEVTPIAIGKLPEATQLILGGASARAVNAGENADHRAVYIQAVIDQKEWFDSLRKP